MAFSALPRILVPERYRQRAGDSEFSVPAIHERKVGEDALPLLATNMRGTFLSTRRSIEGFARHGFTSCPLEDEPVLLNEFYRVLVETSLRQKWTNRCSAIPQAIDRMRSAGVEPKFMVIPESILPEVLGPDYDLASVRRSMALQGYITMVDGMQVLLSNLSEGAALITAAPSLLGSYTRIGDHLGLLFQRVNRAIMVVGRGLG